MPAIASLIEYLATGCGALLWLLPLLPPLRLALWEATPFQLAILAPILYGFGMCLDFLSHLVLDPLIQRITREDETPLLPGHLSETAFVSQAGSHLSQALEQRSARDRLARGFLLNVVLLLPVVAFVNVEWIWPYARWILVASVLALALLAFGSWWRFESLTYRFRRHAVRAILYASRREQ